MEFKEEFLRKCHSSTDIEIHEVPESVEQSLTFLRTLENGPRFLIPDMGKRNRRMFFIAAHFYYTDGPIRNCVSLLQ